MLPPHAVGNRPRRYSVSGGGFGNAGLFWYGPKRRAHARSSGFSSPPARRSGMATFQTGTVEANGIRFHYLEAGQGPLVRVSARLSGQRLFLSHAAAGPGRGRIPGRGPVHARLRANRSSPGRTLPVGAAGPGRGGSDRRSGRRAGVCGRPRLGRRWQPMAPPPWRPTGSRRSSPSRSPIPERCWAQWPRTMT